MKKDGRRMVLDAASDCFAKNGHGKTRLEDISKIVDVRKASLYHYW